jgi:hypothetical protein
MARYTWVSDSGSADWSSTSNWTGPIASYYPGESTSTDVALLRAPSSGADSYTVTYDPSTAAIPYTPVILGGLQLQGTGVETTTLLLRARSRTIAADRR